MNITFNPAKDAANIAKHGVSLAEAAGLEWDSAVFWLDTRRDYDERRMIAYAYIGLRLYCVVFTDRGAERRIISLRKANSREVERYAET
jgi:hypothetical protein